MELSERVRLIAPCGLLCEKCPIRLLVDAEERAKAKGRPVEEIRCDGCRPPGYCYHSECRVRRCCLEEKGLNSCFECPEFVCERLREWAASPHRKRAIANLVDMKRVGPEAWLAEQDAREAERDRV